MAIQINILKRNHCIFSIDIVGRWQKVTKSDFQVNFLCQKLCEPSQFKKYNNLANYLASLRKLDNPYILPQCIVKKRVDKKYGSFFFRFYERINKSHTQTCLLWCKNSTFHKKGALLPLTCSTNFKYYKRKIATHCWLNCITFCGWYINAKKFDSDNIIVPYFRTKNNQSQIVFLCKYDFLRKCLESWKKSKYSYAFVLLNRF